jgi:hypothetical protein
MAGSKTRHGFSGDGEDPPSSQAPRAARTVIGHDIHLQLPTGPAPRPVSQGPQAQPMPGRPVPATADSVHEETTDVLLDRRGRRAGTSRLARFLGRWTTGGQFRPRSKWGRTSPPGGDLDDDLQVPRDNTARDVLLVLGVALGTFAVTFGIVKLRQRAAARPPSVASPAGTVREAPASVLPVPPPAASQATASPTPAAAQEPPLPKSHAGAPEAAHGEGASPPAQKAKSAGVSRPRPTQKRLQVEPPERLKGELLPFSP